MIDAVIDTNLNASEVAAYLEKHPQFLSDYPDLAQQLTIVPKPGTVVSLASYQLRRLRDQLAAQEARMNALNAIATRNETLMQQVHQLNLTMLRAPNPIQAVQDVMTQLRTDFHIEPLRLLLFSPSLDIAPSEWLSILPGGYRALPEMADELEANEPVVGCFSAEQLRQLFGENADMVHSVVVIPLGEQGVLALGDADHDRFQPGMSTLFLKMISATVTTALTRTRCHP